MSEEPDIVEQAQQEIMRRGTCQCPRCGRLHHKSHNMPTRLGGDLSHYDWCFLSRAFNAQHHTGSQWERINDWLKANIARRLEEEIPDKDTLGEDGDQSGSHAGSRHK